MIVAVFHVTTHTDCNHLPMRGLVMRGASVGAGRATVTLQGGHKTKLLTASI